MRPKLQRGLFVLGLIMIGLLALAGNAAAQFEAVALGGLCCFIILIPWIIFIIIAIWVYRDAESRGMSGVLWLIICIILGLIGLIIYLVVRRDHPKYPPGGYPPPGPGGYPPPPGPGGYPPPPPRR